MKGGHEGSDAGKLLENLAEVRLAKALKAEEAKCGFGAAEDSGSESSISWREMELQMEALRGPRRPREVPWYLRGWGGPQAW